jgi:peptidoglycan hydrolase-like protein with peptidoglycan-binding domain
MSALGFAAGSANTYGEQQKKQREWNLDQAGKTAEMERKLHFEKLMGKEKLQNQLSLQQQTAQQQMSPEQIQLRAQLQKEQIAGAAGSAEAAALAERKVQASPESIALEDAAAKRKLDYAVGMTEAQTKAQISLLDAETQRKTTAAMAHIDSRTDIDEDQKETMKWKTKAQALGIPVPKDTTLTPANYLKAKELAISQTKDIDGSTAAKMLFEMTGKQVTPNVAPSVLTDYLTSSMLSAMVPTKKGKRTVTPQQIATDIGELPEVKRQATLAAMKKEDPEMYKTVFPMVYVGTVTPESGGGGVLGGPTKTIAPGVSVALSPQEQADKEEAERAAQGITPIGAGAIRTY